MKQKGWFFQKRIAWAERILSSDSGLRLLTRAMPDIIEYIVVDTGDNRFAIRPRDSVARELLRKSSWFEAETRHFLDFMSRRLSANVPVIGLEIGGHVGTQTVQMAKSGRVDSLVAIEPQPDNFELLNINLLLNGCQDKVTAVNCGVAETEGELSLFTHPHNSGAGSLLPAGDGRSDSQLKVPVRPVATVLKNLDIAPESVSFLWLDAEGMEPQILSSCVEAGVQPEVAAIEFSPLIYGDDATADFIAALRRSFSDVWRLDRDGVSPWNWNELHDVRRQADIIVAR